MKLPMPIWAIITVVLGTVAAQQTPYSIDSPDSIRKSAASLAWDLLQYYKGNQSGQIPGILPGPPASGEGPYYWWQGGAMWGALIDYWYLTGDESHNDLVKQGLLFQVGPDRDFMPPNYTITMGNDDQGFWGMSAMTAAESKFPDPPKDEPQWLALAQAVFNSMASPDRWETDICGGGLRWQVPFSNVGYNYKNSISNGCFFNLGARLARYTDNETYAEWADKTWDWMMGVGFMGKDNEALYDGAHVETNCTDINREEYSYNNAVFTLGAAYMYNYTNGDEKWKTRLSKLIDHGFSKFFPHDIAYEAQCEASDSCTTDMKSFKGYIHRWYSTTTHIAPFTAGRILPVLEKSAAAAIKTCTGGKTGRQCGFRWEKGTFDDSTGAGEQMNALGAVSSLLIKEVNGPATSDSGGTSVGDPSAGGNSNEDVKPDFRPITAGDKAGVAVLTFVVLGTTISLFGWMCMGTGEGVSEAPAVK